LERDRQQFFSKVSQFEKSTYGKSLSGNVRFSSYKPPDFTQQDWEKLLGADVNNLKHMRLMYGFTQALIKESDHLSEEEKTILLKTALTHDWAESVTGDIPRPMKTDGDDEVERKILRNIFAEFGIRESEEILRVMFEKETRLAVIWNSIEIAGYLRTAFNFWQRAKSVDSETGEKFAKTGRGLLCYHLHDLIEDIEIFPHIIYFFKIHSHTIDEIFESETTDENERADLILNKTKWEAFKSIYL